MSAAFAQQARALARALDSRGRIPRDVLQKGLQRYDQALAGGYRQGFLEFLVEHGVLPPEEARALAAEVPGERPLTESGRAGSGSAPPPTPTPAARPDTRPDSRGTRRDAVTPTPSALKSSRRAPPPQIPGYTTLDKIGEGGMGAVYRARRDADGVEVALKITLKVSGEGSGDHESVERFRRERLAMEKLDHPGIVRILDSGEGPRGDWIAMELIDGESLSAMEGRTGVPLERGLELLAETARALFAAHEAGIVHRDLKPSNIMVDRAGRAKLMDFGLAKDLDRATMLTRDQQVIGTPHYLSPEQAAGRLDQIGPATDIWSIGVMLYKLLTGRLPFDGATTAALAAQIANAEPEPPRKLQPSLPRGLSDICMKCLRKDPEERYEDAELLAEDLEAAWRGESVQVESRLERLSGAAGRRPWLVGAILLALAAGAVSPFGWIAWQQFEANRKRRARWGELRVTLRDGVAALRKSVDASDSHLEATLETVTEAIEEIQALRGEGGAELEAIKALPRHPKVVRTLFEGLLARARRRLEQGKARESVSDAEAALALPGLDADQTALARMRLTRALDESGRRDEAIKVVLGTPAEQLTPEFRLHGADLLDRADRIKDALALLDGASSEPLALTAERARLLARAGKTKESEALFKKLLAERPDSAPLLVTRARSLEQLGRESEASLTLARAIRLQPRRMALYVRRAALLRRLGLEAAAARALDDGLAVRPRHAGLLVARGRLALDQGRIDDALRDLELAREGDAAPRVRLEALALAAECHASRPQREGLAKALTALKLAFPDHPQTLTLIALADHGKPNEREALERVLARAPDRPRALFRRGLLALEDKDPKAARQLGLQLVGRDDGDAAGHRLLAAAAAALDEAGAAKAQYQLADRLRRARDARADDVLGRVRRLARLAPDPKRSERIGAMLNRARFLAPDDPILMFRLAMVFTRQKDKCVAALRRSLASNPWSTLALRRVALDGPSLDMPAEECFRACERALEQGGDRYVMEALKRRRFELLVALGRRKEAIEDLKRLERETGKVLLPEQVLIARASGNKALFETLRKKDQEARIAFDKGVRQVARLLDSDFEFKSAFESKGVTRAKDLLDQLERLPYNDALVQTLRADAFRRESNGFVATLLDARQAMARPRSLAGYLHIVLDSIIFLSDKGIEAYIVEPAKKFRLTKAERLFCQAVYNIAEALLPDNRERVEYFAQRTLRDVELCLREDAGAITCYPLRALARGLLGQVRDAEADLDLIRDEENIRIGAFTRLSIASVTGGEDEILAALEACRRADYPKTYLQQHPVMDAHRARPKLRTWFRSP